MTEVDRVAPEKLTCKGCGANPGDSDWPNYRRHYEITVRYGVNAGDHDEYVTEDAGLFHDAECAARYLRIARCDLCGHPTIPGFMVCSDCTPKVNP